MAGVFSLLKIESHEKRSVTLIMLLSVFLGIFNGTFYIGSHSQFLDTFGKEEIANGYMISGIVGIVITFIYSLFQARVSFAMLSWLNLIGISLVTISLRFSYEFFDQRLVDFAYFVLYGPLVIISIVAFWGMVNRIYTLRQGKRLFGIIDAGIIFGIIISSISIPLIPVLFKIQVDLRDLLYVSSVSILLAFVFQVVISQKYLREHTEEGEESSSEKDESISLLKLFKGKYTRAMAIFVGVSVIVAFFAQYSFMAVAEDRYQDPQNLANFLGVFTTTLMIVTFLIKTFVFSRLIKNFGVRTSLIVLPLILILLTVGAVLIGTFSDLTMVESQGFLSFFLIISLSKLLAQALKEGVEIPSFKLLYHSVQSKIRHDVQAKIDGTVNEIFALLAGGLLAVLGLMSFIETVHYSYVLIAILGIWIYSTVKLYREYQSSLRQSLEAARDSVEQVEKVTPESVLERNISQSNVNRAVAVLQLLKDTDPLSYSSALGNTINSGNAALKEYAGRKILENIDKTAVSKIDRSTAKSEFDQLQKQIEGSFNKTFTEINKLATSSRAADRVMAARLVRYSDHKDAGNIIFRLIRDLDPAVKDAAIITSGFKNMTEIAPFLVEMLSSNRHGSLAFAALLNMDETILETIEISFNKTGIDEFTQLKIIQLIGESNGDQATEYLEKKLNFPHRVIVLEAVRQLGKRGYSVTGESQYVVLNILEEHMAVLARNLTLIAFVSEELNHGRLLKDALKHESVRNYNDLFSILSLLYDPASIQYVKENLELGTPESIGFAIELLELFVSEQLKPKLFPLLEDVPLLARIRKLEDYYPIEHILEDNVVREILSSDINEVSAWVKCCAMHTQEDEVPEDLKEYYVANLFAKARVLNESASFILLKNEPELFNRVAERLEYDKLSRMKKRIEMANEDPRHLFFNKLRYLAAHEILSLMSFDDQVRVAELMNFVDGSGLNEAMDANDLILIEHGHVDMKGGTNYIEGDIIVPGAHVLKEQPELLGMGEVGMYVLRRGALRELAGRQSCIQVMLNLYKPDELVAA